MKQLSPACQQIVEIGKALSRDVKILIMDEPTAPLTVGEVETLFEIVRDLKRQGVTIIYISHRLEELFEIADRVTVMRDGAYAGTERIEDINREPTRGIDVGAKQKIYKLMNELVEAGNSIIMVSSDMPELLGMSDRIVVIYEGVKTGEVEKEAFDQNYILYLASGGGNHGAE